MGVDEISYWAEAVGRYHERVEAAQREREGG